MLECKPPEDKILVSVVWCLKHSTHIENRIFLNKLLFFNSKSMPYKIEGIGIDANYLCDYYYHDRCLFTSTFCYGNCPAVWTHSASFSVVSVTPQMF